MEVSAKAKERFCKDCNIPIRLFQEPYFTERLTLFDSFYGTLKRWNLFLEELQKYNCEQEYFEKYNRVKDAAIFHSQSGYSQSASLLAHNLHFVVCQVELALHLTQASPLTPT